MIRRDGRPSRELIWQRDMPSGAITTSVMRETVIIQVRGRVDTDGLRDWVDVLESAATLTTGPVLIDLQALESWTVTAQAVVVVVANRLAKERRLLALCRLNTSLEAEGLFPGLDGVMRYHDVDQVTLGLRLPNGWWRVGVA